MACSHGGYFKSQQLTSRRLGRFTFSIRDIFNGSDATKQLQFGVWGDIDVVAAIAVEQHREQVADVSNVETWDFERFKC